MDDAGDKKLTYQWKNDQFDAETYGVAANGTAISNQLSDSDINLSEDLDGAKITYLSRNDWEGTFPTETLKLALK